MTRPRLVAVVGATATGKSDAAIAIAEAFDGEVINTDAYQLYRGVTTTFAGYDLPSTVASAVKELADDATVKNELEASKLLEAIKKSFTTARTEAGLKRIATRLEQLVAQHGDTEAAAEARQFLDQAEKQP